MDQLKGHKGSAERSGGHVDPSKEAIWDLAIEVLRESARHHE